MRKTIYSLCLTVALGISSMLSAQYLPLKDFQDQSITSGGWQKFVVTSNPAGNDWVTSDQGSTGNFYAYANGYDQATSSVEETELWMVSASFDLSSATNPVLTFKSAVDFNGPDIEVLISSDYDGTSDPSTQGTWTDITSQATLSSGSFNWTSSGDVDLSSYNGTDMYIAFKYTSDPTNGAAAWEFDDIKVDEPAVTSTKSIYDIQFTTNGSGTSPEDGNTVETGGIVMGLHVDGDGYWIQDSEGAWNGIFVFDGTNTPAVGDSVILEADVTEFNSYTQLTNVAAFSIESSGNNSYNPVTVSESDAQTEDYEGVLVRVEQVTCTDDNAGFGNWVVNANNTDLLVGKFIYGYSNQTLNTLYNVQGIMYLAFGEVQILPRDDNDVEVSVFNNIENVQGHKLNVYPNPAVDQVMIEWEGEFTYNLIDMTGKSVMTGKGDKQKMINLNTFNSGVYFLSIHNNGTTETVKVIKK